MTRKVTLTTQGASASLNDGTITVQYTASPRVIELTSGLTRPYADARYARLGVLALSDLADVSVPSPADGDALVWSDANERWEPGAVAVDLTGYYTKTDTDVLLSGYYTKSATDTLLTGYYTKAAADARYLAPAWTAVTGKPTDLAGYSLTADFNAKGDARWVKQTGGVIYDGTNNSQTITFQVGSGGSTQNAAKFWGRVFFGTNNDVVLNSTGSGFMHLGSFAGVTLGLSNGTVFLKAVAGGVTLSAPLIIPAGAPPASATATGVIGQWAWDSGFLYLCIATNTWKRAALSTWP